MAFLDCIVGGVVLKIASTFALGLHADSHVLDIFRSKLGDYEDFQTMLYLCDGTYQVMGPDDLHMLVESHIGLAALAGGMLIVASATLSREKSPDLLFLLLLTCALFALSVLIRRLCVLAIPPLVLLAAFAASPRALDFVASRFEGSKRLLARALHFGLIVMALQSIWPGFQERYLGVVSMTPRGLRGDIDPTMRLMEWLTTNYDAGEIVAADPPLSSMIRLHTDMKIVVHPHAEDFGLRVRHERFFQIYNRLPEDDVHEIIGQAFQPRLIVATYGPCDVRCRPKRLLWDLFKYEEEYDTGRVVGMADVANATGTDGASGKGVPGYEQFCYYVTQRDLKRFRMVYHQDFFVVLQPLT